ncbi:MAG TPA: T9SS type A sorting domain-containing protein [Saprospiraceae bacterium]|nr:T9SS type A sorting domain-containing protein [Saprospiraceae bacterium]
MQKLLLLPALLPLSAALAQPTLLNTVFPAAGTQMSISIADTTGVQPGNAGADQTWDFSGLQALNMLNPVTFKPASQTAYAGEFPFANLCGVQPVDQDSAFFYYRKESSVLSVVGSVEYGLPLQYSDPETALETPLDFGESFSDDFYRYNSMPDNQLQGMGHKTTTYDAFGTLITPLGTFQHAIRLKTVATYRDTTWLFAGYSLNEHTDIQYDWYVNGRPLPQLSIANSTGSTTFFYSGIPPMMMPNPPYKSVRYVSALTTRADEPLAGAFVASSCALYPNPATETLRLEFFGMTTGADIQCLLLDEKGAVLQKQMLLSDFGPNSTTFKVGTLPAGPYFLYLTDGCLTRTLPWEKF